MIIITQRDERGRSRATDRRPHATMASMMPRRTAAHPRSCALGLIVLLAGGYLATTAGCGARTGLYAPEPDGVVPCTDGMVILTKARPTVMFVLDRSGSMGQKL